MSVIFFEKNGGHLYYGILLRSRPAASLLTYIHVGMFGAGNKIKTDWSVVDRFSSFFTVHTPKVISIVFYFKKPTRYYTSPYTVFFYVDVRKRVFKGYIQL